MSLEYARRLHEVLSGLHNHKDNTSYLRQAKDTRMGFWSHFPRETNKQALTLCGVLAEFLDRPGEGSALAPQLTDRVGHSLARITLFFHRGHIGHLQSGTGLHGLLTCYGAIVLMFLPSTSSSLALVGIIQTSLKLVLDRQESFKFLDALPSAGSDEQGQALSH